MKYLAFDIEAANGYKPDSICSIGIVVSDENFNVLSRENLWVNPRSRYNLNGTRKNVGIDLHIDKQLLLSSPDFSGVYDKVAALLTAEDVLVMGHAVDSDVRMLNAACKRYKLPSIDFDFICTQLLYKLYKNEKDVKALNKIADELSLEFRQHNSEDDAWMSLMTLKYLCDESKLTPKQLCRKYDVRIGSNRNFEMTRPAGMGCAVKKKDVREMTAKLKRIAASVKKQSSEYDGLKFAVARSLEVDKALSKRIVKAIAAKGGVYTPKLSACNAYVAADNPTMQDNMREKRVEEMKNDGICRIFGVAEILSGEKK